MGQVEALLKAFQKKYGDTVGGIGQNVAAPDRIPTGVLQLDVASGGGFPAGRLNIIWGSKDVGKSTLLYRLIAQYLNDNPGRVVAFMDVEGNYDSDYGKKMGIDESRLLILAPDSAEDGGEMICSLLQELPAEVGLIAVDSLAAMIPQREVEGEIGDAHVALQGRLISQLCRKVGNLLSKARKLGHAPTVIFLNQVRTKIGVMHGDPSTMPGGHAIAHHASTVIRLRGGKERGGKDGDEKTGSRPYLKEVRGVIEKKKGPIVSRNFEYVMAVEAMGGFKVGEVAEDWKFAAAHLEDAKKLVPVDPDKKGSGWKIMGQEFRTLKECRAWYEDNRAVCRQAIIDHLFTNPDDVGTA